jgi:transcriptional regulator with XRE-family HTH domain
MQEAEQVAANVKRLREKAGLSVIEAAKLLKAHRTYWWQIEKGIANPTLDTLRDVARVLGVTVLDLLVATPKRESSTSRHRQPVGGQR